MSSGFDALGLEVGLEDLVGGARIDVVGARQHPALHLLFLGQVVDGGDRLLVGRGAGVEHVALALLALVLHGVEQDRVQLLEDRQHGLARHRGPAAEHGRDLLLGDQLARLLGEQRPVGGRIDDDGLELLAEQAALLVLLLDQHQHDVLQRRLADRHRAGERMQDADLDRVLRRAGRSASDTTASETTASTRAAAAVLRKLQVMTVTPPLMASKCGCTSAPVGQQQSPCHGAEALLKRRTRKDFRSREGRRWAGGGARSPGP